MYYNSNNAVTYQPVTWYVNNAMIYQQLAKYLNIVAYVGQAILNETGNKDALNKGIKSNAVGYNNQKYNQLDKIYSMAYSNISSLAKNYKTANASLDNILTLERDWNGNGAEPFAAILVEKCRKIVNQLAAEPFICPTACGSIQFEYEKEDGDYLEFEIYEDRIEVYSDTCADGEKESVLDSNTEIDKMRQMVVDFYG